MLIARGDIDPGRVGFSHRREIEKMFSFLFFFLSLPSFLLFFGPACRTPGFIALGQHPCREGYPKTNTHDLICWRCYLSLLMM